GPARVLAAGLAAWLSACLTLVPAAAGAQVPASTPAAASAMATGTGTAAGTSTDTSTAAPSTAVPAPAPAPAAPIPWLVIDSALSVTSDTPGFPAQARAEPVQLPDDWAHSRPGAAGPVWYRVPFNASGSGSSELLGLFIARVCTNLQVWVNGELVHSGGRMHPPVTHNCNHPQLVSLPAALLRPGLNLLDIQVAGQPLARVGSRQRAGGLSTVVLGRHADLAPLQARLSAWQTGVPLGLGGALLLLGGFALVLGWPERREGTLVWFGGLCLAWGLADMRLWWRELPLEGPLLEAALVAWMGVVAMCAVQFLLRRAGETPPWLGRALALQCVLVPASVVAGGSDAINSLARFWSTLVALQVLAAGVVLLRSLWGRRPAAFWVAAATLGLLALSGVVGYLAMRVPVPPSLPLLAQLIVAGVLLLAGMRLVQEHGRALQTAQDSRAALERRVAEISADIERNLKTLADSRIEQVTARERKRIAADLHDDLGAKLLTIVHTSESERIATLARDALEEMRLSVRGLTGKPVQLDDALADWRAEFISRLAQAGIEGGWSLPDTEPGTCLSARAFVQTTRILREAVNNIIKHSGATHCAVSCEVAEGALLLVLRDDGRGISPPDEERLDRGHGLTTMKQRARQLQGQCLVESGPGLGTVVRLSVPVNRPEDPA
ncbi:MAG: sensor histidine kinase, partial [Rubrivivax sp.]